MPGLYGELSLAKCDQAVKNLIHIISNAEIATAFGHKIVLFTNVRMSQAVLQITFLSCTDCTDEFLNGSVHNFFGLYIVLINF